MVKDYRNDREFGFYISYLYEMLKTIRIALRHAKNVYLENIKIIERLYMIIPYCTPMVKG